ncbi:MAG: hypothetical protein AB7F86_01615 [Bdellovibrionales bacterium]
MTILRSFLLVLAMVTGVAHGATIAQLLKQEERPTIEQVMEISEADFIKHYGAGAYTTDPKMSAMFNVFKAIRTTIDSEYVDYDVFILGRDGESLFDAMRASLKGAAKERVHLVQISRKVVTQSLPNEILGYLGLSGFNIEALRTSKKKALFIDTGFKGRIYRSLLNIFLTQLYQNGTSDHSSLKTFLSNLEFRLIASEQPAGSSYLTSRQYVLNGQYAIQHMLQVAGQLYFPTIPEKDREKHGLPVGPKESWKWVVDHMEHTAKWTGRAQTVSSTGQVTYQVEEKDKPLLNKPEYLRRMAILANEFGVPKKSKKSDGKAEIRTFHFPDLALIGETLLEGDVIHISGTTYHVHAHIDTGKRGTVYKISNEKGDLFALKVANEPTEECLQSLQKDVVKSGLYAALGIGYAEVVAHGEGFVLKKFIEGQRADEWVQAWIAGGKKQNDKGLKALRAWIQHIADQGYYIGDLNRKNAIWTGSQWVIIDGGEPRSDLGPQKAAEKFRESINHRWLKHVDDVECELILVKEAA